MSLYFTKINERNYLLLVSDDAAVTETFFNMKIAICLMSEVFYLFVFFIQLKIALCFSKGRFGEMESYGSYGT